MSHFGHFMVLRFASFRWGVLLEIPTTSNGNSSATAFRPREIKPPPSLNGDSQIHPRAGFSCVRCPASQPTSRLRLNRKDLMSFSRFYLLYRVIPDFSSNRASESGPSCPVVSPVALVFRSRCSLSRHLCRFVLAAVRPVFSVFRSLSPGPPEFSPAGLDVQFWTNHVAAALPHQIPHLPSGRPAHLSRNGASPRRETDRPKACGIAPGQTS